MRSGCTNAVRAIAVDNSMGLGRTTGVVLDANVWAGLDKIARRHNVNKAALLRPLIAEFVEPELKKLPRK